MSELTLGIVGCGRIGSNLIKYSEPFNMKINIYDPYIEKTFDERVNVCSNLNELLNKSDIVSLCVHLNSETKGMIGHQEIKEMKKGSFLINTSRGEVIKEEALIDGLKSGKIIAAGVDVVCNEHNLNQNNNDLIKLFKRKSIIL